MEYYYKDLEDTPGTWNGLAVNVVKQKPRRFYFQTSHNERFRLICGDKTLLWGTVEEDHYGVSLLKSFEDLQPDEMPLGVLKSPTIEKASELSGDAKYKFWSRYFIDDLAASEQSLLYEGLWYLSFYHEAVNWRFTNIRPANYHLTDIYNVKNCLSNEPIKYLDWGGCGSWELIAFKKLPLETDGRVKWWRKKIREGSLPPVLVMFSCLLQAYIIIDGHSRLAASYLENKSPEIAVLYSMQEYDRQVIELHRESTIRAMTYATEKENPISVDKLNKILIQAFDDRPLARPVTKAKAVIDRGNWESEVSEKLRELGEEADIDSFIKRWGG